VPSCVAVGLAVVAGGDVVAAVGAVALPDGVALAESVGPGGVGVAVVEARA
jgi:hypothetical protein